MEAWAVFAIATYLTIAARDGRQSVFFFSSRRRHTRCSRDWSSDVCSSDLHQLDPMASWRGIHECDRCSVQPRSPVYVFRDYESFSRSNDLLRPLQLDLNHNEIGRASCRERV